jgi:arylsulfatase A-like enzyme
MLQPAVRDRLAIVSIAAGVGVVVFALFADRLVGGSRGFGALQWAVLIAGAGLALGGARHHPAAWPRVQRALGASDDDIVLTGREVLLLAFGVASGTALLEGVVLAISAAAGEMLRLSADAVWMAAITNAIVLLAVGGLAFALGHRWPRLRTARVVGFLFLLLAIDAIVHRVPAAGRAQGWSKWVLAAGIAAVSVRRLQRALGRDRPWLPRGASTAAALVAVVAAGTVVHPQIRERLALEDPPGDARPNILLIILDTVRAASLGLYGYERPTTPNLERFAASSVVFDRAIATSSWTLPSHGTLFTGRYPNELTADWRIPLDDAHPTLAEVLAARGYATAGFTANGAFVHSFTGLERGFGRFEDHPVSTGEALRTSQMLRRMMRRLDLQHLLRDGYLGRKSARDIGEAFLGWQDRWPADRPFFAFLNYFDAHDPYIAGPPFDTLFAPVLPQPALDWGKPPTALLVESWTDGYDRAIAYIDHELGALFEEMERRGVLDRTVVVITSDHGEHLGENGFMRHGTTLFMPTLHVPLIVRYPPAVPAGARVPAPVTLRDVPATMLDLAGIADAPIPGSSLAPAWQGVPAPPSPLFAEVRKGVRVPERYPTSDADLHSLLDAGLHYIRDSKGVESLFHYEDDPQEAHDLAADANYAAVLARLRLALQRHTDGVTAQDATARAAAPLTP